MITPTSVPRLAITDNTSNHQKKMKLYIWSYGIEKLPQGLVPNRCSEIFDTYIEDKHRFKTEGRWMFVASGGNLYSRNMETTFPKHLYLVCSRNLKNIQFDYLQKDCSYPFEIVSKDFLDFIIENGMTQGYDIASLSIVSKAGERLTEREYYILRFHQFDNALFNFDESEKIEINSIGGNKFLLYPTMELINDTISKSIFKLGGIEYQKGFIFKENLLEEMLTRFYMPEIYTIADYAKIWWNRQDYPFGNDLMIKNKLYR